MSEDTRTLRQALEETYRQRWAGTRSAKTLMSQANLAAEDLARAVMGLDPDHLRDYTDAVLVEQASGDDIRLATSWWYGHGLAPATINKRLNCLSAMGIAVEGCRVKEPKVLKWWLRPEDERDVIDWLREHSNWRTPAQRDYLIGLVRFTTRTGLRIEESLSLTWSHLAEDLTEVTVPGLKTASAQATLALSTEAADILRHLHDCGYPQPFNFTYEEAKEGWNLVRKQFGWENEPTATLKSLRRSAARYLHYDRGMPLDMVRQYLRHENVETTMGYLRLTGGVSLDEQRRYLG